MKGRTGWREEAEERWRSKVSVVKGRTGWREEAEE